MARNRSRKSLYEVFGRNKFKSHRTKFADSSKSVDNTGLLEESQAAALDHLPSESMLKWPKKPRMFQFNAGRVEISMPYQLAITIVLGIVLIALVFYRLGQISYKNMIEKSPNSPTKVSDSANLPKNKLEIQPITRKPVEIKRAAAPTKSTGSNRIVIQTWVEKAQLEPVKWYFAKNGVKTEIRKIGSNYYLVTSDKFNNPQTAGSDGYKALQWIVKLGANYKPPAGFATFGKKPFHDAYGMKFDD